MRVGALTSSLEADALLVRRERVHLAPYSGVVQRLADDGERVRVGSQVVGITPGLAGPADPGTPTQPKTPTQSETSGKPSQGTSPETATPAKTDTPTLALPAQASPAKLEYDRLASEIYATALQLSQARYQGGDTGAYQDRLDQLTVSQAELLPALRGEAEEVPPSPAPLPPAGADQAGSAEAPQPEAADPEPSDPASTDASGAGSSADPVPPAAPGLRTLGTEEAGVVIYQVDGLESVLTPEAVAEWTPSDLLGLPYPDTQAAGEATVAEGGPLFKLVNDLSLEMLILAPASSLSSAQRATMANQGVTLAMAGRDRPLAAEVVRIAEEGEHLLLHLSMPLPSQDALRLRRMRVELLLDEYEGTIVPRTAVDVRQGRTGVWVAEGSRFRFVPVRVVGGSQQEVAVEAALAPDAMVLPNPPPPEDRILPD